MQSQKKLWRMWKVISLAVWIVFMTYWYKLRGKTESEKDLLWERIGKEFKKTLFELNGVLIKVGQLMSIREDVMPKSFVEQIKDLVDHVPPSPWEEIEKVLETEWRSPVDGKLQTLEREAVASASIGEVYKGMLPDGTTVAVKVQRPEIPDLVKTDFRSLGIILWFVRYFAPVPKGFINFKMLYQELKHVIEQELDFHQEMKTAISFKERFTDHPGVKIPDVYPELCTDKVLVMEWVEGVRLNDISEISRFGLDRKELGRRLFRLFLPQWLEAGTFHADPHAGNILIQPHGGFVLLDFGMVGDISKRDSMYFQQLLEGVLLKDYRKAAEALAGLGFLLPDANLKLIEKLLKEMVSIDVEQFKQMDLITVKKEMNDLIKSLPIQVPTRFIFLGRSFATIEGLVYTLCPEEEMVGMMKPAFLDWVKTTEHSKWQLLLKWIGSQPVFQGVQKLRQLIDLPEKMIEQNDEHQKNQFHFNLYESQKRYAFILFIVGLLATMFGYHVSSDMIWKGSAAVSILGLAGYFITGMKQKRWMNKVNHR
ncbi:AarF/ABC1/UbiB kinase family protein [Rossellomorea aquimaris]|uniref:ABC1 kinase family protein n=1 Tax=Rossellomorea aquimaris TaxID=189382 RepID=UPI001CD81780|nr:AarF/UbiB family protein [Rossellomorea aquimaris]MCA1055626.1 AarF/ABC1/UbiB kinase family protein [Rossellomorea aquimaris]